MFQQIPGDSQDGTDISHLNVAFNMIVVDMSLAVFDVLSNVIVAQLWKYHSIRWSRSLQRNLFASCSMYALP